MRKALSAILGILLLSGAARGAEQLVFEDPASDDDGPGYYIYPTDRVYTPGSFDLRMLEVVDRGNLVEVTVTVGAKLENPWEMDTGFSLQMATVYIDLDGKTGSGHEWALPGFNAGFRADSFWEKALILSPQSASRLNTEIKTKAPELEEDILIPIKMKVRTRSFTGVFRKDDLGADVSEDWGFQVLLTSNEGFPDADEIMTRKVNEYEGPHRFGGGSDYDGDPHFMDMLWPPAQGGPDEIDGQHECLSRYESSSDPSENVYVRIPMVKAGREEGPAPFQPDVRTSVYGKAPVSKSQVVKVGEDLRFKWGGKFFTNWLWGNDVSEHSVYMDAFGDHGLNGINSELELTIHAYISDYAEAGARIKNRFRYNYWTTYWNNDNLDEAEYMKLRGYWLRFRLPEVFAPYLEKIHIGSSDLGMFNAWTVGRIRYIDRDNAKGIFFMGKFSDKVTYDLGRISLPELWAGPGWSTRGKGYYSADGFAVQDYALAASVNVDASDYFRFRVLGDYTSDKEGDLDDDNPRDGVDRETRYQNTVGSFEFAADLAGFAELNGVYNYSKSNYDAKFDYLAQKGENVIPQKDVSDSAYKLGLESDDPFGIGLGIELEYFNIGADFISLMAARRETDVLLTEGFEADDVLELNPEDDFPEAYEYGGWWGAMGQAPTLNIDNNDTQFDETYYQSIIGWKGFTALLKYGFGSLDFSGEYTIIDYNTNMQGRDMSVYPLYAGVYKEDQDRNSSIAALNASYTFEMGRTFDISARAKHILDEDDQNKDISADDYEYDKWIYEAALGCRIIDEIYLNIGTTMYDRTITLGDEEHPADKTRIFFKGSYDLGGVKIGGALEQYKGESWSADFTEKYDDYKLNRARIFFEAAF